MIKRLTDVEVWGGESEFMNEVSRHASRGVLINDEGQIALMELTALGLCKLPGGGLEQDESGEEAFVREVGEETGCDAIIIHSLGYIDEHKARNQFRQRSYCYIAKTTDQRSDVSLTENEVQLGMQLKWVPIANAIARIRDLAVECEDYSTKFMLLRDLTVLENASSWIEAQVGVNGIPSDGRIV